MQGLLDKIKEIGIGEIASVVGRYYAMDRDKRWERIEVGLNALCVGDGEESTDPVKTIKERYDKGENDEFLKPIIVGGKEARVKGRNFGNPICLITNTSQMATKYSSSTTDLTVSERSLNCSETSIVLHWRTSHTQRTSTSPP